MGTNYVGDFIADNIMELDGNLYYEWWKTFGLGKSTINFKNALFFHLIIPVNHLIKILF